MTEYWWTDGIRLLKLNRVLFDARWVAVRRPGVVNDGESLSRMTHDDAVQCVDSLTEIFFFIFQVYAGVERLLSTADIAGNKL